MGYFEQVQQTAAALRERVRSVPDVAIVLGSGLGDFASQLAGSTAIPYTDIPNWPATAVVGHAGTLTVGTLSGRTVAALGGRVHFYEGHDMRTVTFATRVLAAVRAAAAGPGGESVPLIYYAGDAAGWLESCAAMGADVIGLDWRLDLDAARARVGGGVALQGNLDPSVLLGPRPFIRQRTLDVLRAASGVTGDTVRPGPAVGHIFNLGHGILPQTPPDHARLLVDSVREFSEVQR